jgi:hypothetical protein
LERRCLEERDQDSKFFFSVREEYLLNLICSLKSEKQNECGKLKVKLGFSSNSSLKSEGKQK